MRLDVEVASILLDWDTTSAKYRKVLPAKFADCLHITHRGGSLKLEAPETFPECVLLTSC